MKAFSRCFVFLYVLFLSALLFGVDFDNTRFLSQPDMSDHLIAFTYDHSIWIADIDGSYARRLTSAEGDESWPCFSNDGNWLAFSGNYDGNTDVYIMPVTGGPPRRLTWHPADDIVQGFTPDGKILFQSQRSVYTTRHAQLFTVSVDGGLPEKLPIPNGNEAQISSDGKKIAFITMNPRTRRRLHQWKNYRGGTASRIWIMDLNSLNVEEIPQPEGRCNDLKPMWVNDQILFVSDRNGEFNLFQYQFTDKSVKQITNFENFPVINPNHHNGQIVFEQNAYLHILTVGSNQIKKLTVAVGADLLERRPRYVSDPKYIRNVSLSPKAKRVALEYRGEIVTVPAKNGDAKNLTQSVGSHDRSPIWSPDGKKIAWFSDQSGEYQLYIQNQDGSGKAKAIKLKGHGFYINPKWSPDNTHISYWDNSHSLYIINVQNGKSSKIDQEPVYRPVNPMNHNWSPDSRYLAYNVNGNGLISVVKIYDLENGKCHPITDGLSDVSEPVFDPDGQYLYMLGSTDAGPVRDWFSQWGFDMQMHHELYAVALNKDAPSPLPFESDEPEVNTDDKEPAKEDEILINLDLDDIQYRIVPLNVPNATYRNLQFGKSGEIYMLKTVGRTGFDALDGKAELVKYTLKERKHETIYQDVTTYLLDQKGDKVLYQKNDQWLIGDASGNNGNGQLPVNKISVWVDPEKEWPQIIREAWRINRDYFYAENFHGLDWAAVWKKYEPMIDHAATRSDLEMIIMWMAGELSVGHSYSGSGESIEDPKNISVGLLGCDYQIRENRYQFSKIYGGLNWRPELKSPLKTAGVGVHEGDFLISVNGQEIHGHQNVYQFFQNLTGKQIELKVSATADGKNARIEKVIPVGNEQNLRWVDWVETNIAKVDKATGGKVAYVHVPNTAGAGHTYFKRYFYPQSHKKAIIVDERFNGGGLIADYYIDILRRPYISHWNMRYGNDLETPVGAILGPKVMIIDENAGSGGDLLPWMFRKFELGKLVGKRTWGGLVGILGFPVLMDGGAITAPNLAIYTEDGWVVENEGVAPDVEVEQWPKDVMAGKDPQLEKAIDLILKEMKKNPFKVVKRPKYPVRIFQ